MTRRRMWKQWLKRNPPTVSAVRSTGGSTAWGSGGGTGSAARQPVLPACRPSETPSAATSTPCRTRAGSTSGKPSSTEVIYNTHLLIHSLNTASPILLWSNCWAGLIFRFWTGCRSVTTSWWLWQNDKNSAKLLKVHISVQTNAFLPMCLSFFQLLPSVTFYFSLSLFLFSPPKNLACCCDQRRRPAIKTMLVRFHSSSWVDFLLKRKKITNRKKKKTYIPPAAFVLIRFATLWSLAPNVLFCYVFSFWNDCYTPPSQLIFHPCKTFWASWEQIICHGRLESHWVSLPLLLFCCGFFSTFFSPEFLPS